MLPISFISAILIAFLPFLFEKSKSKKARKIGLPVTICIIGLVVFSLNNIERNLQEVSSDLLDTQPFECSSEILQHLSEKNSSEYKNILIVGSDARPGKSVDDSRYDLMYIVQCSPASITIISLERDTQVLYAGTNKTGKLNAASTFTGRGIQGLIDTIMLNFSISIDEYAILTWENVTEIIKTVFPNGYTVKLSEIEELGINQVLLGQNSNFGHDRQSDLLPIGEDTNYYGIDVIEYLRNPINFIVSVNDKGKPLDKFNRIVDVKEGMNEHVYEVNKIIKGTPVERVFSNEEHSVTLNEFQTLAYARVRYCYASQNKQREINVMNLMGKTALTTFPILLSPQCEHFIQQLSSNTTIITSYETIEQIINDIKISRIKYGVIKNGKPIYSIPYIIQNGELTAGYYSYKEQTDMVLYGGDDNE